MDKKNEAHSNNEINGKTNDETSSETKKKEHRPRKGLEDWELLQTEEEPPLKIPYWLPIIIGGLFVFAIIATLPLLGVREGFERPWLDSGLLVGAGYGITSLVVIYLFMRKKKTYDSQDNTDDKK